jgi:hypothetical protein
MMTTFEKGVAQGIEMGQRQLVRQQVELRFGPLSAAVVQRLEVWPADRLSELASGVLTADSLVELGLAEEPDGAP